MSLHWKIVWLFIGMAALPLLVVAELNRRQNVEVMLQATGASLTAEAHSVAKLLASEAASADQALQAIAELWKARLLSDGELRAAVRVLGRGEEGQRFQTLELLAGSGTVLAASSSRPAVATLCTEEGRSRLVSREIPVGSSGRRLVGTYWAGYTLQPAARRGLTVFDADGRLVLAPDCGQAAGALAFRIRRDGQPGRFSAAAGDPHRYGAFEPVEASDWTVVVTAPDLRVSREEGFLTSYWLVLLGVATATLLTYAFAGQVTGKLKALTEAAERVGAGNLRPWLPPPSGDEVGRLTVAFSLMMSRVRDTMDQADQSGRLAVIGKLSSYLAHEIRNPLSAVKMNLQRLERWTRSGELPSRCREPIELSLSEVDRLSSAVSSVLQLSRSHHQAPEVVSVHELVKEAGTLLENQFARHGVAFRWELDAEADRIVARRGQIKGVILNLMLNALDAQPQGGELLIRSRLAPGVAGRAGPRLDVSFLDQGVGVPQEIRERIFEPFFTTKRTGSGIGLAVAGKAIRDHGGDLWLEDPLEVGKGAEFVVSLPLAAVSPDGDVSISKPRLASWMEGASVEGALVPE